MSDEFDADAFDAMLSFLEEYTTETLASFETPAPSPSSEPFLSSTLRFSGATPSELVAGSSVSLAETLAIANPCRCAPDANSNTPLTTSQRRVLATNSRKPQVNPNRVRNELRFELAFLRRKTVQLEQELSSLQQNAQANLTVSSPRAKTATVCVVSRGGSTQELDAWKGIAARQRTRREDSERENSRLRIILEKQRKTAVDMTNSLRKRVAEYAHIKDPYAKKHRFSHVQDFHGDLSEFRELFGHLEAAYDEVDAVLAANGLARMEEPTEDVHIRQGDGKYLEFIANKILPFGLRETTEAAWDHFKGVEKHCGNGGLYEKAAKNLDQPYTVLEDFTKELYSNNYRADMKAKQIVRRYVEAGRDLVVFVSRVFPVEIKHKMIEGMTYHFRGYVVIKPSPASTPGHELTMLQFCSRISIDKQLGMGYDHEHIRAAVRFLIGNTVGNIRCYQERIENALVDRTLQQQLQCN